MAYLTQEEINSGKFDDYFRNEYMKDLEQHRSAWEYSTDYRNMFGKTPEEQAKYAPKVAKTPDENTPSSDDPDFIPGVKRGIQETQAMLYGAGGIGGSLLKKAGAEDIGQSIQDWGLEGYRRNMKEAEKHPAKYSFKDVYTGKSGIGGAIDWAQGTLGTLVPSMAEAAAGAAIGTLLAPGEGTIIGAFGARTFIKKSIEKLTKEAIESGVTGVTRSQLKKQVTKQALKRFGGQVGMGAAVLPLEAGGMYAGLFEDHGVDAPETALLFGAFATALEYVGGNSKLINNFIGDIASGSWKTAKKTAKELLKNIPEEAGQEAGQSIFEILNTVVNTDEKMLTIEHLEEVIESAAAGALGGGAGAMAQSFSGISSEEENRRKEIKDRRRIDSSAIKTLKNNNALSSNESLVGVDILGGFGFVDKPLDETIRALSTTPTEVWAEQLNGKDLTQDHYQSVLDDLGLSGDEFATSEGKQTFVEAVIPKMAMSLQFGIGSSMLTTVQKRRLASDINNMEDPEVRTKAIEEVEKGIKDPTSAKAWANSALDKVDSGEEISLSQDFVDYASQDESVLNSLREGAVGDNHIQYIEGLKQRIDNLSRFRNPTIAQQAKIAEYQEELINAQAQAENQAVLDEFNQIETDILKQRSDQEASQALDKMKAQRKEIVDFSRKEREEMGFAPFEPEKDIVGQTASQNQDKINALKKTEQEDQARLDAAKEKGDPIEEIDNFQKGIIESKAKDRQRTKEDRETFLRDVETKAQEQKERELRENPPQTETGKKVGEFQDSIIQGSPRVERIRTETKALDLMTQQINDSETKDMWYDDVTGERGVTPATSPRWMKEAFKGKLSRKEALNLIDKYRQQEVEGKTLKHPITKKQQEKIDKYIKPAMDIVAKDHADEFMDQVDYEKDGFFFFDEQLPAGDMAQGDQLLGYNGTSGVSEVVSRNDEDGTVTIRTPDGNESTVDIISNLNIVAFKESPGIVDQGFTPKQTDNTVEPPAPDKDVQPATPSGVEVSSPLPQPPAGVATKNVKNNNPTKNDGVVIPGERIETNKEYDGTSKLQKTSNGYKVTSENSETESVTVKNISHGKDGFRINDLILDIDGDFVSPGGTIPARFSNPARKAIPYETNTKEESKEILDLIAEIELKRGAGKLSEVDTLDSELYELMDKGKKTQVKKSVTEKPVSGRTTKDVHTELKESIKPKQLNRLLKSGKLSLVQTQAELIDLLNKDGVILKEDFDGRIQGVYDPNTGITHLVADNISKGDVDGIIRHEMGVHSGLRGMLGEKAYQKVVDEVNRLIGEGDKAIIDAKNQVPKKTDPRDVQEEIIAYFAQNTKNKDHSLYKRIANLIKVWAIRMGIKKRLTTGDISDLIDASLRRELKSRFESDSNVVGHPGYIGEPKFALVSISTKAFRKKNGFGGNHEQVNADDKKALKRALSNHVDKGLGQRLKDFQGTPWEAQATTGLIVRQAIQDALAGKPYYFPFKEGKVMDAIKKNGEEGLWNYIEAKGESLLGHPSKSVTSVNSALATCNPSKDCAKFCYACKGNYGYPTSVISGEYTQIAIELDPVRAAKSVANAYKALPSYFTHKALRIFDKGDFGTGYVDFIKALNDEGVRTHVFSKKPADLRQISDKNIRLLSIDPSNTALADSNPDLPIAYVFTGTEAEIPWVKANQDRIQVTLPVKIGKKVMSNELINLLPKKLRTGTACPIDAGTKEIVSPKNPHGWTCNKCDTGKGIGCYKGQTTIDAMGKADDIAISAKFKGVKYGPKIEKLQKLAALYEGNEALDKELDDIFRRLEQGVNDRAVGEKISAISDTVGEKDGGIQYSITSTTPWKKDFPNITTHTSVNKVAPNADGKGGHPDHKAAKAGDHKAASRLVASVVNKEKIKSLKKQHPNATVVPVWAQEASGVNAIPGALASAFRVVGGFKVDTKIHQTNQSGHTKKNALQRILSRAKFGGKVIKGMEYIIVDDVVTTGETISELKHYIENNGGIVVNVSTLAAAKNSTVLALKPATLTSLKDKFNEQELRETVRKFDIVGELQALTESEARYILKFGSIDSFRNKIIAEGKAQGRSDLNGVFEEAVQYQIDQNRTTPITSTNLITPVKVKAYFDSMDLTTGTNKDGSLWVRTPAGLGFTVKTVDRFSPEAYRVAIESGAMKPGGHIAGNLVGSTITLSSEFGDAETAPHEWIHAMENAGILSKKDITILNNSLIARKGLEKGDNIPIVKDGRENRANYLSRVLANREAFRGTPLGDILQRIADFMDSLYQIARETIGKDRNSVRQIAKGMESGKIYSEGKVEGVLTDASAYSTKHNTETPAFKKWFGKSVVTVDGKPESDPLVVYHSTPHTFDAFDTDISGGAHFGTKTAAEEANVVTKEINYEIEKDDDDGLFYVTADNGPDVGSDLGPFNSKIEAATFIKKQPTRTPLISAYLHIENIKTVEDAGGGGYVWVTEREKAEKEGYDGLRYKNKFEDVGTWSYMVFNPTQIKSTENNGTWNPEDPRIQYSVAPNTFQDTPETLEYKRVGKFGVKTKATIKERFDEAKILVGDKMRQGFIDQFHSFRGILNDPEAHMMATLTKSDTGVLMTSINDATPVWDKSGAIDIIEGSKSIKDIFKPLGTQLDDFLAWIAAHRSEKLLAEDRENRFTPELIAAGKTLNKGREQLFNDVRKDFEAMGAAITDIAVKTNLINEEEAQQWKEEGFYVPFYRMLEEEETSRKGPGNIGGLTNQKGYHKLKGADKGIEDLLTNTLLNWSHLISAGLRNQAGKKALESAEEMGIATRLTSKGFWSESKDGESFSFKGIEGATATISVVDGEYLADADGFSKKFKTLKKAKAETHKHFVNEGLMDIEDVMNNPHGKDSVYIRENGREIWYNLDKDPEGQLVLDSLLSLNYEGLNTPSMKAMRMFKRALTQGVTLSPGYKIRNLIRDSIHAPAVTTASKNPLKNIAIGFKYKSDTARMNAGGGAFSQEGYIHGNDPDAMKNLIGVGADSILNTPNKIKNMFRKWESFGVTLENVNRVAGFRSDLAKGKSLLEANYNARDQMNFSGTGSFNAVRTLTQVIPFMNSRIQGLDKIYRAAMDPTQRKQMAQVMGIYTLASVSLMLAMSGDEDYDDAPEWEKRTYHMFKIPGVDKMFRIPRPFEVGAIAYMTEQMTKQFTDKNSEIGELGSAGYHTLSDTFSMSIVPQAFKPMLEVYSNRNSFRDSPIESMSMQNLSKKERFKPWTSDTAKGISSGMSSVLPEGGTLSPLQIQHLVGAYTGWAGATALASIDLLIKKINGDITPETKISEYKWNPVSSFARDSETKSSKYVTQFYDNMSELNKMWADIRKYRGTPGAKKLNAQQIGKLRYRKVYNKMNKRLSGIRKKEERIYNNTSMSASEKRLRLKGTAREKNAIAKRMVNLSKNAF